MAKNKTLKVGDTVIWCGSWGFDEPKEAVVESIEKIEDEDDKYGTPVGEISWDENFIVTLTNDYYAFKYQLSPKK